MKKKLLFIHLSIILCLLFLSWSVIYLSGCKKKTDDQVNKVEKRAEKQTLSPDTKKEDTKIKGLTITTFPRDSGYIRRQTQPLYIYFSHPIGMDDFSFEVYPEVKEWKVDWQREGKIAILKHTQPFLAGEVYVLDLSVISHKLKKKVKFTVYGPSSLELINKDDEENLIDLDTA